MLNCYVFFYRNLLKLILDYKALELFGKPLFEKAVIQPPMSIPNPMQDEACFIFVFEGTNTIISALDSVSLKAKEAVLLKCGNYAGRLDLNQNNATYHAMVIHLVPEVLKRIYKNEVPDFLKKEVSPSVTNELPVIKGNKLLFKYIDSILFYFENPGLASEELLALKIKELFMLLMHTKNAPEVQMVLSQLFAPRSFSIREIVEAHLYEDISVAELATLANLSLSSFKRKFKEIFNESTAAYLKRKKLERASDLLMATNYSVSEVAYDAGFNDLAHFSRSFKSHFGRSPSDYRSELKKQEIEPN